MHQPESSPRQIEGPDRFGWIKASDLACLLDLDVDLVMQEPRQLWPWLLEGRDWEVKVVAGKSEQLLCGYAIYQIILSLIMDGHGSATGGLWYEATRAVAAPLALLPLRLHQIAILPCPKDQPTHVLKTDARVTIPAYPKP